MFILNNRFRRKWQKTNSGVIAIAFCLTLVWLKIKDLFPRIEFTQWLGRGRESFSQSQVTGRFMELFYLTFDDPSRYNARNFSWIFESGIGPLCKTNITCANTIAFVPVALYIIAIFLILSFIGCSRLESSVGSVIVLLSFPSISILSWQATIPDRLAAFLFCVSLIYIYKNLEIDNPTTHQSILVAFVFFSLSLLSVSSKEAAWILLPITLVLPFLFLPYNFYAIVKRFLITLPSVLFMVFHILNNYVKIVKDPHLLGGNPFSNLRQLSKYLFQFEYSYIFVFLITLALFILLVQAIFSKQNISVRILNIRILSLAFIAFISSWVIPIRTQFASPFYMWLPTGVTIISVMILFKFSTFRFTSNGFTGLIRFFRPLVVFVLYFMVLATSIHQFPTSGGFVLKLDQNFQNSRNELADFRKMYPDYRISFWAPSSVFIAYQFVSSDPASHFWYFVGGSKSVDEKYASQLTDSKCGLRATKSAVAVFNEDFKLVEICSR
jgi:hypothetical protein